MNIKVKRKDNGKFAVFATDPDGREHKVGNLRFAAAAVIRERGMSP